MSNPASSSAALPIAYVVLRILTVLNWLGGAAILALLVVLPNRQWSDFLPHSLSARTVEPAMGQVAVVQEPERGIYSNGICIG